VNIQKAAWAPRAFGNSGCFYAAASEQALALFSRSIEAPSKLSSVALIRSVSCSKLVALAIGAVMEGLAKSRAGETLAGVIMPLPYMVQMASAENEHG
jgi:hypothetical protein